MIKDFSLLDPFESKLTVRISVQGSRTAAVIIHINLVAECWRALLKMAIWVWSQTLKRDNVVASQIYLFNYSL